jgi:ribokinase
MMGKMTGTVTVLGSINMDVVLRVSRFPQAGETVIATGAARHGGGKGANQAIAAARAGGAVTMIGRVGDDADGRFMVSRLKENGIDCAEIAVDRLLPTGAAYVTVDESGENEIIVAPGANSEARAAAIPREGILLAQLELPLEAVSQFFEQRREHALTILNAAPFTEGARGLLRAADLVIVNEVELAGYCNVAKPAGCADEIVRMAKSLLSDARQQLIVTRGSRGSITIGEHETFFAEAPSVEIIDTTGAGDCFCGFLAAQLSVGRERKEAITIAHRAATLSVTRAGASSSIPTMSEVLKD